MLLPLTLLMLGNPAADRHELITPSTVAQSTIGDGKEKKLCRLEETTGSLFPKRVCSTKAEWAAVDAERSRGVDAFNSRMRSRGPGTSGD